MNDILSLLANSVPRGYTRKIFPSISDVWPRLVLEMVGVSVGEPANGARAEVRCANLILIMEIISKTRHDERFSPLFFQKCSSCGPDIPYRETAAHQASIINFSSLRYWLPSSTISPENPCFVRFSDD
jgi:hypothetical protein